MSTITFTTTGQTETEVRLDNKLVGRIRKVEGGYQYSAKGASKEHAGEVYSTLAACKKSLIGDDDA